MKSFHPVEKIAWGQWQEAAARAKGAKVIVHQQRQGLLEGCGIFDDETWLSLAGHWAIFSMIAPGMIWDDDLGVYIIKKGWGLDPRGLVI